LTFALLLGAFASAASTAAWATGEFIQEIRFFSRSGMDTEDNLAYFHGRLGILRPTFDDNRLFAAYRQMMGGTFTDAQARQLLARCCDAPGADDDTLTTWTDARKRVLGPPPAQKDTPARQRPPEIAALDASCFPNAYRNAAATLLERIKQHGAGDPAVREWTIGEDAVLANCMADSAPPADVPNAPAWLQADRAYQVATAYFYRYDYAHAGELYAAIGQDAASPWRKLARDAGGHRRRRHRHRRRCGRSGACRLSGRRDPARFDARLRHATGRARAGAGESAARRRASCLARGRPA
jgi:hypothetical protein